MGYRLDMEATRSSPPACQSCKGSRKIIKFAENFDSLPVTIKVVAGYGFVRELCSECNGLGTLNEESEGSYAPPQRDRVTQSEPVLFASSPEGPEIQAVHKAERRATNSIELSDDQKDALSAIFDWFHHSKSKRLSLAGYAGTGKTVLISEIIKHLGTKYVIKICAPTGKAAAVLRKKNVPATTFHKLIYSPETVCMRCSQPVDPLKGLDKKVRCPKCGTASIKVRWVRTPIIEADLVIVDESSMLNQSMIDDIEFLVKKILYVGDHGQLEPIGVDPGIMRNPDIRLETIHRQATESGIVQFAHYVRQGHDPGRWIGNDLGDARVVGISKLVPQTLSRYDVILCGYNKTRKTINAIIRDFRGYKDPLPQAGEQLICLQNDSDLGIYNGLLVTVLRRRDSYELPRYDFIDDVGNEYLDIQIHPDQFHEEKKLEFVSKGIGLFDFGTCITVHKAQGSEWDKVAVIHEIARSWSSARWSYTAATRAAKRLEYWMPTRRLC